ncbi:hypothetical protein [Streptosporangium pseudovulgare]|uniref:DUF2637 domain-containing protein n=1 Tax=Streptosporangium pseudovulgare TaxID=35765 RepID=A0ABQ2RBH1_9ACTN|nr:hypothetical protein [Streptosporangium pseudovulgare]GGQ20849.1 hypothetical protein GCM10010140_58890 [Streptosporangium pseudovulgare]
MSGGKAPARWPLLLLALPAGVATWSGWVGLGQKTGFGLVTPLPGIADGFQINTAITLPIGVETYAAYALGTWLSSSPALSAGTRRFAKWSSIGSLLLGMLGQVAYHLLEVAGYATAPGWIVTVVSCLPVLVLGMGAGLGHMLSRDAQEYAAAATVPAEEPPADDVPAVPEPVPDPEPDPEPDPAARRAVADLIAFVHRVGDRLPEPAVPGSFAVPEPVPGGVPEGVPEGDDLAVQAAERYRPMLAAGKLPSFRTLKNEMRIGQERAQQVRAYLATLTRTQART